MFKHLHMPWQWWVINSAGPHLSTLEFKSNMYWTNTRLECLPNLFRNSPTPNMPMIGSNSTTCLTNGARSWTIYHWLAMNLEGLWYKSSVSANPFIVHAYFNFTFLSAKLGMVIVCKSIVLLDTDWQIDIFCLDFVQCSQSMCFVNIDASILSPQSHQPLCRLSWFCW